MRIFGFSPRDTAVTCPRCGKGTLLVRRSCTQVRFQCQACEHSFLLADLVRVLDDAAFAALAEVVGDRLSDRV